MAFSDLFTKLRDVEGELEDPNGRNDTNGQEASSKRKPQTTLSGPNVKRQRLQPYAAGTSNSGQNEETKTHAFYRRNQRTFSNDDNNRGNTSNATKKKKNKGKKKRERESENGQRYRNAQKNQQNGNHKQPRQPFMSQEFKEQNSLEVDGRLLCIHFIRGRCMKGEECQFEHIEGYNGLIKEACKFYIQGYCLKGKSCPYLHETFPCKFFHKKGYCRRDPCMFSHDPLTDFTRKLLNDLIQRENEIKKKAEEDLSQTENVCEAVEENTTMDFVIPTARPLFYHSLETPVDEGALNALQTENNLQPEESLPSALDQPGPVCYSVEAMLGPKLFKPCLYTAPKNQETPLYDPKTTDNRSSNLINNSSTVANVNTKSATTSSLLPTPSIAPSILASCQSKHKERILIFDDKYSVSPSIKEKMFKKPSCQDFATSGYHNKQYKKPDSKLAFCGAKTKCEPFNAKGELRVGANAPNSMLKDKKVATDCNRQYITLMGNDCQSQKYLTPHIQKDKFGECERGSNQSYFKDKPELSLKSNDKSLSNSSFKKAMTPIQQCLKETNSETSLNVQSSSIKNVEENRQENVASPCNKTTSRLNSLFASLTPDVEPTSAVRSSVSGTTTVQSAQRFESHCGNQKFSSSKTKQKEIESDTSPPAKKFHGLFASLTPDSDRTPTVSNDASEKPAVRTAPESVCASKKSNYGSNKAAQPSQFTDNMPISTNSKTDYHSKKLVSTSFKCSDRQEDMESTKTLPAKPFQSLFASLTPDSDRTSTVINSVGHKPAVPSSQKVKNSICDHQKVNCDSSQTLKPSQCTGNTSESPNNCSDSNHIQMEASTETPSNNSQGLVTSSARSKFKVTNKKNEIRAKTPPEKSFQSLFASLTPDSDQTSTVGNHFSKNTAVPSGQRVEQSICTSEKINCGSNQATNQSQCPGNTLESTHNSINHSERLVSATTNLKCSKKEEDTETAKTPPAKSFQSLFASLTPDSGHASTVSYSFRAKPAAPSAQKGEKSICDSQKVEYDLNQTRSPKNEERTTESTIITSCNNGTFGLVGASTETSSGNCQKLFSSATSDLKSTNNEEGIQSAETPLTPFSSLTPTVTKSVGDKPDVCQTEESKTCVFNTAPASPQQKNNGRSNSILRTLFQQLRPYE